MRRWVVVAAAVVVLAACSRGSKETATTTTDPKGTNTTVDYGGAEAALRTQIQQLSDGQFGRMYDSLHPAQQALISRDKFVTCYEDQAPGGDITDVKVKDRYTESIEIPGTQQHVQAVALTTSYKLGTFSNTETFHEVTVDGRWTWTFSDIDSC
jgi:hypothetical protein